MKNQNTTAGSFNEKDLISFKEGLFGFEQYKKFLPVSIEENSDAMLCLECVEDEELSFWVMNPFLLKEDYQPELSKDDFELLGEPKEEELSYYVLCAIKEPVEESTVNLKCPIAVNVTTRQARQVILQTEEYGFRHTLKTLAQEEGDSC